MKITKLDDIEVYQEALLLTKEVFDLCQQKSLIREFCLCDQLKRASISICANIAEGFGRKTKQDFAHFLSISLGSCNETLAMLDIISLNITQIQTSSLKNKYSILGKRIFAFRQSLLR